jgi:hypothetical protein
MQTQTQHGEFRPFAFLALFAPAKEITLPAQPAFQTKTRPRVTRSEIETLFAVNLYGSRGN